MTAVTETKVTPQLSVEVLQRAKEALVEQGWTRGALIACKTGEICALGAVAVGLGVQVAKTPVPYAPDSLFYELRYPYEYLQPSKEQVEEIAAHYDKQDWAAWREASTALWKAYDDAEEEYLRAFHAYQELLYEAIARRTGEQRSVPAWNDSQARSVDDVLAVFDTAIEILQENK